MNIVKGVADLLRRSSGGQVGEGSSWTRAENDSLPSPSIRFSETGEEAILNTLWQRYENTTDKVEKRKCLQVFLLHFIQTFKDWEPGNTDQLSVELTSSNNIILGCAFGHPSEVVLIFVQEISRLTSLISELNNNASKAASDTSNQSSLTFSVDGLYALNSLMIANQSMHNCKVFIYYGGVQKVTALLKAAVVQLKTLSTALSVDDEQLSVLIVEKTKFLQKILGYTVSIVFIFMDLYSFGIKPVQHMNLSKYAFLRDVLPKVSPNNLKGSVSEIRVQWQQKTIVLVMEAGGVNWLVELLRVIRRLNLKEQWTDLSLQYLTLSALKLALFENPRAQNHFRSIGGLEVLLDGIGPPSTYSDNRRTLLCDSDSFGNMNNMQFLCENGRIHKFANSLCWPVFMLQEWQAKFWLPTFDYQMGNPLPAQDNFDINSVKSAALLNVLDGSNMTEWTIYSFELSKALCSFLIAPEDIKYDLDETLVKSPMTVSLGYLEFSIRWLMKVLLTIFPCIKACCNEAQHPNHIRALSNTMQRCILGMVRKVLVSAPALLEIFREEGIWDLIFSKWFFYFELSSGKFDLKLEVQSQLNNDTVAVSESQENETEYNGVDSLQMESISFLEFAAALSANSNNLPECSVLLDALDQSAHNPEIATLFLRSLQRILRLTPERSLNSFKSLGAVNRVLKFACIQAQVVRKFNVVFHAKETVAEGSEVRKFQESKSSVDCMQISMEIFNECILFDEHVCSLVLHNDSCIDCLFDLFWEEDLRKIVIEHILELFKLPPLLPDDQTAKLHLCVKYLETFTRAKELEILFPEMSIFLLINMRKIILVDPTYYQKLFCDGECFLHIVSLLNGTFDEEIGEQLILNVLQTLTLLLNGSRDLKLQSDQT